METQTISEPLLKQMAEYMEKHPSKIYWDYRDELSKEQIETIITKEDGINDVENAIWEMNDDYIWYIERQTISECIDNFKDEIEAEAFDKDGMKLENIEEDIKELLREYSYVDMNIKDLLRNTGSAPAVVIMYSNYDCQCSNWGVGNSYEYIESYFGDMVDALNLNPAKVKQTLSKAGFYTPGKWPNKKNRDGYEAIHYERLIDEMGNNSCTSLLVFIGRIDLEDFIGGKPTKVVIPRGNSCGMYSPFQGGGSLIQMEIKKDLTLPLSDTFNKAYDKFFRLTLDSSQEYGGIKSVYGVSSDFFGDDLKFIR